MAVVCLEADIDSNAWIAAYTAGTTNVSDRIRFLHSWRLYLVELQRLSISTYMAGT